MNRACYCISFTDPPLVFSILGDDIDDHSMSTLCCARGVPTAHSTDVDIDAVPMVVPNMGGHGDGRKLAKGEEMELEEWFQSLIYTKKVNDRWNEARRSPSITYQDCRLFAIRTESRTLHSYQDCHLCSVASSRGP